MVPFIVHLNFMYHLDDIQYLSKPYFKYLHHGFIKHCFIYLVQGIKVIKYVYCTPYTWHNIDAQISQFLLLPASNKFILEPSLSLFWYIFMQSSLGFVHCKYCKSVMFGSRDNVCFIMV